MNEPGTGRRLRVEKMGTIAYGPMLELQKSRHTEVKNTEADDTLFLLEHPSVITRGRNADNEHILATPEQLTEASVELFDIGRGGDVTFHGPGQVVGYPIMQLQEKERDVRRYVTSLEEILIRTAADFGVRAMRVDGLRGIWVEDAKLAAIGVRLSRWTTMHGFALNVSTDLRGFDLIVPCGLQGKEVTSLEKVLGEAPPMTLVQDRLVHHTSTVFDREPYEVAALTGVAAECTDNVDIETVSHGAQRKLAV